jgi:aminotransferase
MRPPAQRLSNLRESVIREMTRLTLEHGAINLAQGFPDFPPPPEVIAAAHAAIDAGHNQYAVTWGIKPLRDALSAKLRERYALEYDPERHVTVTCGVTEAITAALLAAVDPGGEVVIEPFHENHPPAATFAGARGLPPSVRAHLLDPASCGVLHEPTRAILINSPHNPSGASSRARARGRRRLCIETTWWRSPTRSTTASCTTAVVIPLATCRHGGAHDHHRRPGKTFAVTGWRPATPARSAWPATALRTVHDFNHSRPDTAAARGRGRAGAAGELRERSARLRARRARMMAILREHGWRSRREAVPLRAQRPGPLAGSARSRVARHLIRDRRGGKAGLSFYGTPGLGRDRSAGFAKKLETLDRCGAPALSAAAGFVAPFDRRPGPVTPRRRPAAFAC